MSTPPPTFGPTEILGDDDTEAFAIVQVALAVPLDQLRAALLIGHAQTAGEPPLTEMTVLDIRREVEGHLWACAVVDLYREADTISARLVDNPELAAELDAAIDRAYTRPTPPPARQQAPRYGDGTVTLQTRDRGEVTVPEPGWCTGHDDDTVGHFADITHNGAHITAPIVTARYGPSNIMTAHISHAPHLELQPEPHPVLSVEISAIGDFDPEDGHNLARALRVASARIDRTVTEVTRLRGEGQ